MDICEAVTLIAMTYVSGGRRQRNILAALTVPIVLALAITSVYDED